MLEKILKDIETKNARIIGMDGLGGAGKSTLSEKLVQALTEKQYRCILLHIDDFIHPRAIRYNAAFPEWQCYYDLQWRYDYFADVVGRIRSGRPGAIDVELYDKEGDGYISSPVHLAGNTLLIVEGIFLQRRELRGLFDYMIYIDVPEEARLRRVLQRDTYIGGEEQIAGKYHRRYFPAERRYVEEYHPRDTADLVIDA